MKKMNFKKSILPFAIAGGVILAAVIVIVLWLALRCDHDRVIDAAKAPTCVETGLTEGEHCSKCGKVFVNQEVLAKETAVHEHNGTVIDTMAEWNINDLKAIFENEPGALQFENGDEGNCQEKANCVFKCTICDVTQIIIGVTGEHVWDGDKCTVCQMKKEQ